MLDAQRHRPGSLREEVTFTRRILTAHLVGGLGVLGLTAGHGFMTWSAGAGLWYVLTLPPLLGLMAGNRHLRHLLGLQFLFFSLMGIYFLTQVMPGMPEPGRGLISVRWMPFWLGALNVLYAIAGACLMMSQRVRRAAAAGFSLR